MERCYIPLSKVLRKEKKLKELSKEYLSDKEKFINTFINAENPATGSAVDSNANVTNKTLAVLEAELFKQEYIQVNRNRVYSKLLEMFGAEVADNYLRDIKEHLIYIHDETSLRPYCASITLYPFLMEGTKTLGGTSKAPKNLQSFCGSFVNLVYQIASDFAGAVATVEFLMYFDYFAKKTYGANYLTTHTAEIAQELQGVVYAMNQPAAARGAQSVFWNISVFDSNYFKALFDEFYFPDGSTPDYKSVEALQRYFMKWFRNERRKELLTFPVLTAAYLVDPESHLPVDQSFTEMLATEMSKGHSFFHYESTSADSLSSCCRLRNEMADNTFSYTLGAGGVSTGSFQVITMNLNRIMQKRISERDGYYTPKKTVARIHKYLVAFHSIVQEYIDKGILPSYQAGYIALDKQFGTIGINGALESFEWFTMRERMETNDYTDYLGVILAGIKEDNKRARETYGIRFNTEFVPAENLGVKNAKWDKEDGLWVPRDCYNSYFFPVEDNSLTILDRLKYHSEEVSQYLDGGAACHLNLNQLPTVEQAKALIEIACRLGVPYWTTNVLCTICKSCGTIDPVTRYDKCHTCGSKELDYGTRVIGYLKPISSFAKGRQIEAAKRHYMKGIDKQC